MVRDAVTDFWGKFSDFSAWCEGWEVQSGVGA